VDQPLLDVDGAAAFLGLARSTVYAFVAAGRIPYVRLGDKAVRFEPRALEAWVAAQRRGVRVDPDLEAVAP
jgi:excisionase family DNA binding protein